MRKYVLWIMLTACSPGVGQVIDTGVVETFNGVSTSPDGSLTVAVGNGGQIVHLGPYSSNPQVIPSGTQADLFDVYVLSPQYAVISGLDVILTWDGSSWSMLLDDNFNIVNTPVWSTPEQDQILFRSACRVTPGMPTDRICRLFNEQALVYCGRRDDIKMVLASGDIWHLDNTLNNPIDPFDRDPLFDQVSPLNLIAAWIPPTACTPGPLPPARIVGVSSTGQIAVFKDGEWTDKGPPFSPDQATTWVAGTDLSNIIVTGFRTTPGSQNSGSIQRCDLSGAGTCTDLSAQLLPSSAKGLADLSVATTYQNCIFNGGDFEDESATGCDQPPASCLPPGPGRSGECSQIIAVGEDGEAYGYGSELASVATTDLAVNMVVTNAAQDGAGFAAGTLVEGQISLRTISGDAAYEVVQTVTSPSVDFALDCEVGSVFTPGANFRKTYDEIPGGTFTLCRFRGRSPLVLSVHADVGYPLDRSPGNNTETCVADTTGLNTGCPEGLLGTFGS